MRKIILYLLLLAVPGTALADSAGELMGLGMNPALAKKVVDFHNAGAFTGNITAVGNITAAGNLVLSTTGKTLKIHDGTAASACMGTTTANGTTAVTVSTTCAATGSRIFISRTGDGSGSAANDQVGCWTTNIVANTSFDLDCSDANDNATFNWLIIKDET